MRHFTLFMIFIAISSFNTSAQPPDTLWTRTFGGVGPDQSTCMQLTNDGGYIITGYTYSFGPGDNDIWLIKTDSTGNEEWTNAFGRDGNDFGSHVQQTRDNGFIIVGTISLGANGFDVWLIKTDSTGNEEWNRTFGGNEYDGGSCVQETIDDGYIITGYTSSSGSGNNDVWLIKTDSNGDEEWNRTFGGTEGDGGSCVQQTNEGGYIIAGATHSFGAGRRPDAWIIKTNSDGEEEWNRIIGGGSNDYLYSIHQTNDGGYILAGRTASFGDGSYDMWLVKIESNGDQEWNRTFGGNDYDDGHSGQQTIDGGYIITGNTEPSGAGESDILLVKTDSTGNEEWSQTFGGVDRDFSSSIQQTNDGGYIICGWTDSFGAGREDVWLIRLAAEETGVIGSAILSPTDYILEEVYPNPFNSTTTISVELPAPSDLNLSVFNITGQEIAVLANEQYSVGFHQFTFTTDELSSGIYFIHASVPGKMDEVRKVVLIR